jgi:protein TonB
VSANEATSATRGGDLAGAGQGGRGGGYTPPRFLLRYKPLYPAKARVQRLEGTVLLRVSVDAVGHVSGASLQRSCGHTLLDRAALEAVRSWRFIPAHQADRAVSATVEVPIRFTFST